MSQIKHTLILSLSAIISGILNYLTYPIFIRHLSISDYAEFSVYMSLLPILAIPVAGFGYAMLIRFRQSIAGKGIDIRSETFQIRRFTMLYVLAATGVSLLVFTFLDLSSWWALGIILVTLIPSVYAAFFTSMFQALEYFLLLALVSVIASVLRLGLSFGVLIDSSVWIAIVPIIVPSLFASAVYIIYGRYKLRTLSKLAIAQDGTHSGTQSIHTYIVITAIVVLLQNIDVLIVKVFSSDYDVTLYASVGVIVKFALIMIAVLETVSAPVLVDTSRRDQHKIYVGLLIFLSIVGYVVSLTFLPWAGNILLHFLKGELDAPWMLWSLLGVAMVSLGFFSIFIKVYMSWGHKDILYVWILSGIIGLGVFARSIEEFVIFFTTILVCLYTITLYKIWCYMTR